LTTQKIDIRPLQLSDATELSELANNKNVWDNLRDYIPYPYSKEDAIFFINLTKDESPQQSFAITFQGKICGVIGLIIQKDVYQKSAEIGYWLGEPYWKKGIATKAVALFLKMQFLKMNKYVMNIDIASLTKTITRAT